MLTLSTVQPPTVSAHRPASSSTRSIDVGSTKIKGLLHLVTVAGYALARGLAKQGVPADSLVTEIAGASEGVKAEGFQPAES
jgi:hypothetical protein